MADIAADKCVGDVATERYETVSLDDRGPLHRHLSGMPCEQPESSLEQDASEGPGGVAYATLGLLDGSVVARLQCHESLGKAVLGRGSLSDIRMHDPFVHRVHAEIHWNTESNSHIVTHGGGANGTFVNMQRIDQPTRLIDGARIRVGKTELIYRRFWYPTDRP